MGSVQGRWRIVLRADQAPVVGQELPIFPTDIAEHALAHTFKDEAEAAYQRGEMLLKRATVMEKWAQFCAEESPTMPNMDELLEKRAA